MGWCWLVEFGQLTGVPATLAAHSTLARLALGTTFHPADLLWYGIGATATFCLYWTVLSKRARRVAVVDTPGAGAEPVTVHGGDVR